MEFLNLAKVAKKYDTPMLNCVGNIARSITDEYTNRKNSKKGVWIAVNSQGELKCGQGILVDGSNTVLDELAGDLANGRVSVSELK